MKLFYIMVLSACCNACASTNDVESDKFVWLETHDKSLSQALASDIGGLSYVEGVLFDRLGWKSLLTAYESTGSTLAMADFMYQRWQQDVALRVAASTNTKQKALVCRWFYGTDKPPEDRAAQILTCLQKLRWRDRHKQFDFRMDASPTDGILVTSSAKSTGECTTQFVLVQYKDVEVPLPVKHEVVGIE